MESNNRPIRPIWQYVLNSVFLTVLALAVLIALNVGTNWAFDKFPKARSASRSDWTKNRVFSLDKDTLKLLDEVDKKQKTWELDMLDEASEKEDPDAITARQVKDLLEEYESNSKMIKTHVYTAGDRGDLEQKIRERYSDKIKPVETFLDHSVDALNDMKKFLSDEGAIMTQIAGTPGMNPEERSVWMSEGSDLTNLPKAIDELVHSVKTQRNTTLPQYNTVIGEVQEVLNNIIMLLQMKIEMPVSDPDFKKNESEAGQKYYATEIPNYKKAMERLQSLIKELGDLQEKEEANGFVASRSIGDLQKLSSRLQAKSVVVFAPDSVQVITAEDMTDMSKGTDAKATTIVSFQGEKKISTAIKWIIFPEQPKVVIVSQRPMNAINGPFSGLAHRLIDEHFDVREWSAMPDPQNPEAGQEPPSGKGVVWIVFPPVTSSGMDPNSRPEDAMYVSAVSRHMSKGGAALFLSGYMSKGPDIGIPGSDYAFNDMLANFGINVREHFAVLHLEETPEEDLIPSLYMQLNLFPDNLITKGIQGSPTVLIGASPLELDTKKANTTVEPLVSTPEETQFWSSDQSIVFPPKSQADLYGIKGKGDADKSGPFTLAAIASQKREGGEQRVAVFGSTWFAINDFSISPQGDGRGGVRRTPDGKIVLQFPGNLAILANTVSWLAGYDNIINVGSNSAGAARIKGMSWTATVIVDGLLGIGVPVLLLGLGGMVYYMRRRSIRSPATI